MPAATYDGGECIGMSIYHFVAEIVLTGMARQLRHVLFQLGMPFHGTPRPWKSGAVVFYHILHRKPRSWD